MKKNVSFLSDSIAKSTVTIFIKATIALLVAFILSIFCAANLMKPVMSDEGVLAYMDAEFVQDMIDASLRGRSLEEIHHFISESNDELIKHAQIAEERNIIARDAPQKYGIFLLDFEKRKLLKKKAFWTKRWRKRYSDNMGAWETLSQWIVGGQSETFKLPDELGFGGPKASRTNSLDRLDSKGGFSAVLDLYLNDSQREKPPVIPESIRNASYIVIPVADTSYVIFARKQNGNASTIPISSIIMTVFSFIVILMGAALFLVYPMIRRIRKIQVTCQQVSEGNYSARCSDHKRDSLGVLAHHIDNMTSSIEQHLGQQKSLLQAVAHEIRTPLARIRFSIEMLDISEDDENGMAKLNSIDEDLTEVENLIKELSYFNYVDAGKGRQNFESSAVKDLIDAVIHQRSLDLKPFDVSVEGITEDMLLEADPNAFRRVIGNLLSNAARYAIEKIQVSVSYSKDKQYIEVAVDDDGPGIPVDKREDVFTPFMCLEKSRSKAMGGFGLGLAIAHRIMKIHSGTIEVQDSPLGGCRMFTRWPLKPR
ncbi:MAG: hypothetical protein J6A01_11000 [Proteobacteria bacterium]|nr:hypothetical protein [Pseudomonadota bacterium]